MENTVVLRAYCKKVICPLATIRVIVISGLEKRILACVLARGEESTFVDLPVEFILDIVFLCFCDRIGKVFVSFRKRESPIRKE